MPRDPSDTGDLTPWLAFCAEILPLHATPEEARRMTRPPEVEEEDFEALLASEEGRISTLPPPAGGAGGGLVQHAPIGTKQHSTRNPQALERGRELRQSVTESEKKLWGQLRSKQMYGFKFHRQQSVGAYIVDFVAHEAALIVELDGGQHAEQENYDTRRTRFLEQAGFRVLRFWNHEVMENLEGVLQIIGSAVQVERTPTLPSPAGGGGQKPPPKPTPTLGQFDGVDAATARRMKRGQLVPDAVLDLHGYSLVEAFSTLAARVRSSRAQGVRLLLVITGKGRARGPGGVEGDGKLRQAMPHWLGDAMIRPHVVAATAANRTHGGSGAFYLLLRKPGARGG